MCFVSSLALLHGESADSEPPLMLLFVYRVCLFHVTYKHVASPLMNISYCHLFDFSCHYSSVCFLLQRFEYIFKWILLFYNYLFSYDVQRLPLFPKVLFVLSSATVNCFPCVGPHLICNNEFFNWMNLIHVLSTSSFSKRILFFYFAFLHPCLVLAYMSVIYNITKKVVCSDIIAFVDQRNHGFYRLKISISKFCFQLITHIYGFLSS